MITYFKTAEKRAKSPQLTALSAESRSTTPIESQSSTVKSPPVLQREETSSPPPPTTTALQRDAIVSTSLKKLFS